MFSSLDRPVANDTNEYLATDDANYFQVVDSVDPLLVTGFVVLPARLEGFLE